MARAELIFVEGPQQGQRVVLPGGTVVLGRSPKAEVHLKEPYASREHVRLSLTYDGWILENLSSNGTNINGKLFKSTKKKVLLATGDVLGIGQQAQLLFVAEGDDTEEALAAYRQKHQPASGTDQDAPSQDADIEPASPALSDAPPAPSPATAAAVPAAAAQAVQPKARPQAAPATAAPGDEESDEAKPKVNKKYLKYGIMFGVYLLLLVGFGIALSLRPEKPKGVNTSVPRLTDEQISEMIRFKYAPSPNKLAAQQKLREANAMFDGRQVLKGNMYLCLRSYKQYAAWRPETEMMPPQDELKFNTVADELVALVQTNYNEAWKLEQARNWPAARALYQDIIDRLPEDDSSTPVGKLKDNVRNRLRFVLEKTSRLRRGR